MHSEIIIPNGKLDWLADKLLTLPYFFLLPVAVWKLVLST